MDAEPTSPPPEIAEGSGIPAPAAPEAPEAAKWIQWGWHHLAKHREAFMKPPIWAALVIVAAVAYSLGSRSENERLGVKDERIKFLNDQIAAYKDRLKGATPDEAAKKFSDLETVIKEQKERLDFLYPSIKRRLNQNERDILKSRADRLAKDVRSLAIFHYPIGDSPFYAGEFYDVFQELHIAVPFFQSVDCEDDQRGVLVGLTDPDKPSAQALDFISILKEAGIKPMKTKWDQKNWIQDFDLFICPTNSHDERVQSQERVNTPEKK
jgi:hypothetical protein